ncbi:MAG: hypothetical protein E7425_00025 [Ruminococcaceae bacterium]|nr:hypothetical protein [Oscillospiraceae bacterium]
MLKKKHLKFPAGDFNLSISGDDRVIIDDTGSGSTTGTSKMNTSNWEKQGYSYTSANPDFALVERESGYDNINPDFKLVDPTSGYASALADANRKQKQADRIPPFFGRVGNTVIGGVKRSLASDINSAANAYDLTQGARDGMLDSYSSEYARALNRAKSNYRQMERLGADARELAQQWGIVDDWQRKYDAVTAARGVQREAAKATYSLADGVKSSADTAIENAKRGLGSFGRFAVDVGAKATQIGTDAAKSSYLLNRFNINSGAEDFVRSLPLVARTYGENTQAARQDGADALGAAAYGAASALTDAWIEKWLDGLGGVYGGGSLDKGAEKIASQLTNNKSLQPIVKAGIDDFGEGFLESVTTDLANQLLKASYNKKGPAQNWTDAERKAAGHDILVNTIIGILLGDSGMD